MDGVVNCAGAESQIYQFGSNLPLGTFVPIIVKYDLKTPPPSTSKTSPLVMFLNWPGSTTLILTQASEFVAPLISIRMTGWIGGNIAASSLLGNGGCVLFCGYMRNNFQSELFMTTKAYPSKTSDCGGKNSTSMEMKLAAPKDFEADCIGKRIAALTDSMWKFKKYSRESGNPTPFPKSSEIMDGIDCKTSFGVLAHKAAVAVFEPQLVEVGIESHCVKSGNSLPFTRRTTTAFMFKTGKFVGSIWSICCPVFIIPCPSQTAIPNPSIISAITPQKTHFWPQWDFRLDDLKSSTSRYSGFSANDSKYNPHTTAAAPSDAKTEIKRTSVIYFLVTGIPFSCFVAFAFWCGLKFHKNLDAGKK